MSLNLPLSLQRGRASSRHWGGAASGRRSMPLLPSLPQPWSWLLSAPRFCCLLLHQPGLPGLLSRMGLMGRLSGECAASLLLLLLLLTQWTLPGLGAAGKGLRLRLRLGLGGGWSS